MRDRGDAGPVEPLKLECAASMSVRASRGAPAVPDHPSGHEGCRHRRPHLAQGLVANVHLASRDGRRSM